MFGDAIQVQVTGLVKDEGSLVLLSGIDVESFLNDDVTADVQEVVFACERRQASDILDALQAGDEPVANVPVYMVVGGI